MNDIAEIFSNARLRFVKATVVSNLFPMYPHLGQMEMNFAAKINGRFEIVRLQDTLPRVGTEIEVVWTENTYPRTRKPDEMPIGRYTFVPLADLVRLKAESRE